MSRLYDLRFNETENVLTRDEVAYWKAQLAKTLKVGVEFEAELPKTPPPELQDMCGRRCPCVHRRSCTRLARGCVNMTDGGCGSGYDTQACLHQGTCRIWLDNRCPHQRGNSWDECPYYERACGTTLCPAFEHPCTNCEDYQQDESLICEHVDYFQVFRDRFQPTNDVNEVGSHGVLDIVEDGSLRRGIEIPTVGRRVHLPTLYEHYREITDFLLGMGCHDSPHCGFHIHVLSGYNSYSGNREMERHMPSIIVSNYHQLHNLFAPELMWLTSTGEKEWALTRYTYFRRPMHDFDCSEQQLHTVADRMRSRFGKYAMVNLNHMQFARTLNRRQDQARDIYRFHVELRYPDLTLSPSVATAWVAMSYALLMRAVEISQKGILLYDEEFNDKKKIFELFANEGVGNRESDTSEFGEEEAVWFANHAERLVMWLKPAILSLEGGAGFYEVLKALAAKPVSLRRARGQSWQEIEDDLRSVIAEDEDVSEVEAIIVFQQITQCKNMREWIKRVAEVTGKRQEDIQQALSRLRESQFCRWDGELGSMIIIG